MNFRVVDEHGRQWGTGRNLGALKAELGTQARGAFQAFVATKKAAFDQSTGSFKPTTQQTQKNTQNRPVTRMDTSQVAIKKESITAIRHTAWTFGELPELLEIQKSTMTLIGYPALIDAGDGVTQVRQLQLCCLFCP